VPATATTRFRIVSALAGRVRVQFASPWDRNGALQEFAAKLARRAPALATELVPAAGSVVVRYSAAQQELADVLREIESAAAAAAGLPSATANGTAGLAPVLSAAVAREEELRRNAKPPQRIVVLHSIPGRLRVRIPGLRRYPEIAALLESRLGAQRGVTSVETRLQEEFLIICYDPGACQPVRLVRRAGRLLRQAVHAPEDEVVHGRDLLRPEPDGLNPLLIPTAAVGIAAVEALPLAAGVLGLASLPIAARAMAGARDRRFNVDQLDLAAVVTMAAVGQFIPAALMTWLIGLGEFIRARTARRARRAVSLLMSPDSQQAWVEREGQIVAVPVTQLAPGETVFVYPGDQVPVDGVVTGGEALVDQKALTGEAAPALKEGGDPVYALTGVLDGQLAVRVEHIGRATRAGRVVELIENAPLSDTRVQNHAERLGTRLVAPIFGLAGVTYLFTGDPVRVAAVLILDFATGIRISAPTTVLAAMTGAARQGLFIKGGKAMEQLARVDAVVFDKTGTLTRGEPSLQAVTPLASRLTPDELLRRAASAEMNLKHPAARAIVAAAQARGLPLTPPEQMSYALGLGITSRLEGETLQVGSERFMQRLGIDSSGFDGTAERHHLEGRSLVYVAIDGRLAGMLAYSDPPRAESALVVRSLLDRGVKRIVMLTGDQLRPARAVARELRITDLIAEALPEQKAETVQRLRGEGFTVAVIGDGINDSPALACADVSISLEHGSDLAKETADVILLDGDLRGLPRAMDLSRDALGILRQNQRIVLWPNAGGLLAAAAGIATPLVSTLINNGTAVLTGLNALRPLFTRPSAPPAGPHLLLPGGD
jgi:Cu2+-exporting ATPase